jgi:translation initiation factor IF-2
MEEKVGVVEDYFARVGVAGMRITEGRLRTGDTIHIKGHTTDITFKIDSMEIEHVKVEEAKVGDDVGIKVAERVRSGDVIYLVRE